MAGFFLAKTGNLYLGLIYHIHSASTFGRILPGVGLAHSASTMVYTILLLFVVLCPWRLMQDAWGPCYNWDITMVSSLIRWVVAPITQPMDMVHGFARNLIDFRDLWAYPLGT